MLPSISSTFEPKSPRINQCRWVVSSRDFMSTEIKGLKIAFIFKECPLNRAPSVHNYWRSHFTCRATWRPLSIWLEPFFPVVVGFCVKPGVVERSCHVFLRSTGNADDRSANFFSPVSFSGRVTEVQEMSRIWVSDVQLPIMQLMPIVKSETGYWRCRGGSSSHHCQYDPQGICKITRV